jgi:hypothetical protein
MGAIVAIVIGAVLLLWANKRVFDRRNAMGVEEYGSFAGMIGSRIVDVLTGLVGAVAAIGGVAALIF